MYPIVKQHIVIRILLPQNRVKKCIPLLTVIMRLAHCNYKNCSLFMLKIVIENLEKMYNK